MQFSKILKSVQFLCYRLSQFRIFMIKGGVLNTVGAECRQAETYRQMKKIRICAIKKS
jgi:hypothetical protein